MPSRWFTGKPHSKDPARRQSSPRKRSSAHGRRLEQRNASASSQTGPPDRKQSVSAFPTPHRFRSPKREDPQIATASRPRAALPAAYPASLTGRRNGNSGFSAKADSLPSRQRERAYPISPIRQPGTGWNRLSRFPKTESACRTASENQRKRNESPMTDKRDAGGRASRISFHTSFGRAHTGDGRDPYRPTAILIIAATGITTTASASAYNV